MFSRKPKKTKVLIVDDHQLVRKGFASLLNNIAEIEVVGELENGQQLLDQYRTLKPDVVLLDLFMPVVGGMEALKKLLRIDSNAKAIVLTMCDSEPYPTQMLQAGAVGYFTKNCELEELAIAILKVPSQGKTTEKLLSSDLARKLALKQVYNEPEPITTLTNRELQVFSYLADGKTVNDISEILHLSSKTVGTHRTNVMSKLHTKSVVDLAKIASRYGVSANY